MKNFLVIILFVFTHKLGIAQCNTPTSLFSSNINYYNADANWNFQNNIHHYKIRYKIIGATSWSFKNNIDSLATSKNINNLQALSTYIWQIRAYCDSTGSNYTPWSATDTFYTNTSNCPAITGLYTSNINYNNAIANWSFGQGVNRYKVHYRIYGTTNWQSLGFIDSLTNNVTLPLLQQNTTYEWEVMAYYDSTTLMQSLWSVPDTFTTGSFIAALFNPIISNTIGINTCNTHTDLSLYASQSQNEPDIGTTTITSDGGYFDIQSLSFGDSVGYAIMNTSTQSIQTTLEAGIIAGQNYAIINSYDSTGSLIGFFAIENINGGIKVSTTSPNDGNNYTNGFTSEIHFTNLFVNPNINGYLNIYTDIQSELNDQLNDTSSIFISCTNSILESNKNVFNHHEIFDLTGRKSTRKKNKLQILVYPNGEAKKVITLD